MVSFRCVTAWTALRRRRSVPDVLQTIAPRMVASVADGAELDVG